jgi:hypothetical protein
MKRLEKHVDKNNVGSLSMPEKKDDFTVTAVYFPLHHKIIIIFFLNLVLIKIL